MSLLTGLGLGDDRRHRHIGELARREKCSREASAAIQNEFAIGKFSTIVPKAPFVGGVGGGQVDPQFFRTSRHNGGKDSADKG